MTDRVRTKVVDAGAEAVWAVLADFGSISAWAGNVDHSCVIECPGTGDCLGVARRVQVGRNTLVERILECEPNVALAYDVDGLPARLKTVRNRWTLEPAGCERTQVSLTSSVEIGPRPPQRLAERVVSAVMARQSDVMLAGLAAHLESSRG